MPPAFWIVALGALAYYLYQKGGGLVSGDPTSEMVARVKKDYYQDALDASREFPGIPWKRILAMICQESGGAQEAIGSVGERGLMQITREALSDFNTTYVLRVSWDQLSDPNEERLNIFVGAGYLKILLTQLGNLDRATRAYNVGAANVLHSETSGVDYLKSVEYYESLI